MEELIDIINEITPKPSLEPSLEEYNNIKLLLESGIQTRDIFIDYNYPLEWAIKVENDLKPVIEEEIIEEIINE